MDIKEIVSQIHALPEISGWSEMIRVFERAGDVPRPDWELVSLSCQAVGGKTADALPGAAAVASLQISIMLVDDILDEDPRGEYRRRGAGPTSNMALAFQAMAFKLMEKLPNASEAQRNAAHASLAHVALATAYGQQLDVQNLSGEENYWRVVQAKSTPFYGGVLQLGAILGGAKQYVVQQLYDLGVIIGEIIQIEDDLTDAFQKPANADWRQGRNNLLILYALTAVHEAQNRFQGLLNQVDDEQILEEAQQILIDCGAVSYAAFQLVNRYQRARRLLDRLALPNPAPLIAVLEAYAASLLDLLRLSGAEVPPEILHRP